MSFVHVGDIELFYELTDFTAPWKAGPDPVVFIHGLGGDHRMWNFQVPAFCAQYPVLTVDLRGHGQSGKPQHDFTVADMARDVVRVFRDLGIERAHVVGLSLGGMVAQQLALDYPLAVTSLVLVDTTCGAPPEAAELIGAALQAIEDNPMAVVAAERITNAFSDAVDPVMRAYLIDRVSQNDHVAYVRAARATFGFSSRARLGEITVPTLVVFGDADRVTPLSLSEELAERIAGARLARLPGAGHIAAMERPEDFNRVVLQFLRSVTVS